MMVMFACEKTKTVLGLDIPIWVDNASAEEIKRNSGVIGYLIQGLIDSSDTSRPPSLYCASPPSRAYSPAPSVPTPNPVWP